MTSLEAEIPEPVMTVCGCDLGYEETVTLIERLADDPTVISNEAADAIRYMAATGTRTDVLERDIRDAITHVLYEPLPHGLTLLREAISTRKQSQ